MRNLQEEVGNLSVAEKFELLDAVWESLEASAPALTSAQQEELDHRMARYEKDPTNVIPWEQVKSDLFKKR